LEEKKLRPGVKHVRRAFARALRKRMTPAETRLWMRLRMLRPLGHHFRRQAPFGPYVLDFVCFGAKLVVEVDGDLHGQPRALRHDARRDAVLKEAGFRTLRVSNADVLRNVDGVMHAIMAELPCRE